jgi:hypothetical protein
MRLRISLLRSLFLALLVVACSLLLVTCKYPNEPVKANTSPETRLSNVPANDTLATYINLNAFPELTLSWIGDDPDGYVIAFRYRWTDFVRGQQTSVQPWTTILNITRVGWENVIALKGSPSSVFRIYDFLVTLGPTDTALVRTIGDSLAVKRAFAVPYKTGVVQGDSLCGLDRLVLQTPTTGTFIFSSPVDSNLHRFEVSSIDNSDAIDPTPAIVNFWTLISPGSVCVIDQVPPANSLTTLVPTERFRGLRFAFRSLDPNNTNDLTFSWAVDDTTRWSPWSIDGFAYVTGRDFNPVASGTHRFFVRARNRWGVISPAASASFTAVIPRFVLPNYDRRILVINSTPPVSAGFPRGLDTNAVRARWTEILDSAGRSGKFDIHHLAPTPLTRFPSDSITGRYSLIIYSNETFLPPFGAGAQYKLDAAPQATLGRYLLVGGNLIISGIQNPQLVVPAFYSPAGFGPVYAHVAPFELMNNNRDFIGANGLLGYPNIPISPASLPPDSGGALRYICANFPVGFGESISTFDSRSNDPGFEGLPLGVRFLAPDPPPPGEPRSYSVVYFGFPLHYAEKSAAIQAIRKALSDVQQ